MTPMMRSTRRAGTPEPLQMPAGELLELVTYGYVPWSTSSRLPWAASRRADGACAVLPRGALLFHVVREDQRGMVAPHQVAADGNAGGPQGVHLLQETGRIDDNAVADDGGQLRVKHAAGQQGKLEG